MVTPNRDRSISIPRLEEDWKRAKLKGQGEIIRWACQHLSIEIGLALRSDRSVGADFWEQSAEKSPALAPVAESVGQSRGRGPRKSEVSLLRDFEEVGDLAICKELASKAGGFPVRSRRRSGSSPIRPCATAARP